MPRKSEKFDKNLTFIDFKSPVTFCYPPLVKTSEKLSGSGLFIIFINLPASIPVVKDIQLNFLMQNLNYVLYFYYEFHR